DCRKRSTPIAGLDCQITKADSVSQAELRKLVDGLPPFDADEAKDKKAKDELLQLLKENLAKLSKDGKETRLLLNGVTSRALIACMKKSAPTEDPKLKKQLEDAAKRKADEDLQKLLAKQKEDSEKEKAEL